MERATLRFAARKRDPRSRWISAMRERRSTNIAAVALAKTRVWDRDLRSRRRFNTCFQPAAHVKNLAIALLYQANQNLERRVAGRTVFLSFGRSLEFVPSREHRELTAISLGASYSPLLRVGREHVLVTAGAYLPPARVYNRALSRQPRTS
jgi:hypothetical protein